jgi:glycosidase
VKLAALCLFTLPHPPALYYGTEIGLSQEVDKDAGGYGGDHVLRPEMPWDRAAWNTDLLDFFRRLIAVRRAAPALRRGRWRLLDQPSADVVAYQLEGLEGIEGLEGLEGSERIEVHLNLGASHQTIDRAAAGGEVLITVGEVVIGGQPAALGPRSGCCIRFAT